MSLRPSRTVEGPAPDGDAEGARVDIVPFERLLSGHAMTRPYFYPAPA
jgi:hypothetical protein